MSDVEFKHLLGKARDAAKGGEESWCCQSTGEKLAVALVLNRADWLKRMNYTIAEAIDRVGPVWMALIPRAEKALKDEGFEFEDVPF